MGSALETLAPVLAAFPTAEAPLTPEDVAGTGPLASAVRRVAAPDLVTVMIGPDQSFREEFRGVDGLIEAWTGWLSPYESFRLEVENLIESDDVLVACVRQFATPVGGGLELDAAGAAVWWVREGRLVRVEFNLNREAALRSAGLDPQSSQS